MIVKACCVGILAVAAFAQSPPTSAGALSARELYFKEKPTESDNLPTLTPVAYKKSDPKPPAKRPQPDPVPVVEHLGLRYRVLLVDKNSNSAKAVDADSVFHNGDCLALELEPNRTGYLYVLAKESSGNWNALFPNPEMAGEAEIVQSRNTQRAPQKFCFELDEDKGMEHLYVILSRNPSQVNDLNMALLKHNDNSSIVADASSLNKEAGQTVAELGSRGFKISKTGSNAPAGEKYSVYVVPAALEKKDTVFAEIKINHQ